ncbi:CheY-like chemotaxis protein [Nonomuraea rubra]|uniref:CheY-like chemotaxis protein n=1 Tax=Nonomuraea rubra TaxID=46180 RepID=A0A7X0U277_9ACTN|nr:CheY-like chemotaxis protein [Nonomuraea rubra]
MKVLAVADSDSYLKWAACLLGDLPSGCVTELVVVRTPIAPSREQIVAAVNGRAGGPPPVLSARSVRRLAERTQPDVILVACTGPVVDVLVAEVLDDLRPRPVFVSGLPGISVPATEKAWLFRSGCDLFVVHSEREVAEFSEIASRLGGGGAIGLARLPFLRPEPAAPGGNRVVFATQAKVPKGREERERVLLSLAELAARRPDLDVVVKLRALEDERQTHNERFHYQRLWREMGEPGRLAFEAGSMQDQLQRAAGFVTVSSTAALEAIAMGVPSLVLRDFGVSAEMINLVFEGSDLLGTLDELAAGEFREASGAWCAANYFHPAAHNDWAGLLSGLVVSRPRVPARSLLDGPEHAAGRRRARLRVEVPPKMLRVGYRAKRRMRRYLRSLT